MHARVGSFEPAGPNPNGQKQTGFQFCLTSSYKVGEVLKTTNTVSTFQKACAACGARKTEESYGDTYEPDGKHNIFDLLSFFIFGPNTVITVS